MPVLNALAASPEHINEECMETIEMFEVLLYDRTAAL
jgi:hypothetical protein